MCVLWGGGWGKPVEQHVPLLFVTTLSVRIVSVSKKSLNSYCQSHTFIGLELFILLQHNTVCTVMFRCISPPDDRVID